MSTINNLLKNSYDLHIHIAPDVVERKCNEWEVAKRMLNKKMKGGVIKCHFFETAARARLLNEKYPELNIVGGVVLNRSVGGLNPEIVKQVAKVGGKMLWFPTMDAKAFQEYKHKNDKGYDLSKLITITDNSGNIKPEVIEIIDLVIENNMVLCTGHLGTEEGIKLVEKAFERGVKKVILTHVEHPAIDYSIEQQKYLASLGAYIEHSFNNIYFNRCPLETVIKQIKEVGVDKVILTGDFGQKDAPFFDDAMEEYLEILSKDFSREEIDLMVSKNPEKIIND